MLVSSHVYETLQMLSKPKRYLQNLQWNMHFELAENMHSYPCVDIWSCSRRDVIRHKSRPDALHCEAEPKGCCKRFADGHWRY